MKIGDRVIGTVASATDAPPFKPEGPVVDFSGEDNQFVHVYTQYGAVWRIPAADCQSAEQL